MILPALAFSAVSVTASVDANRLQPNETFTFKVETQGADEFPSIDISTVLENFTLISGPGQQSNFQWINGKMSGSRTMTWTLLPKKSGTLKIPALEARIGRNVYMTEPIQIVVGKSAQASQSGSTDEGLFVVAEIDKEQVYPGEQVTVTYKFYTRVSLRGIEYVDRPSTVGFWVDELYSPAQPQFRDVTIKGVQYKMATLYKAALFPTKVGELDITPMVIRCQVEVRNNQNSRRSRRSLFDDFFNDSFGIKTVPKIVSTKNIKVEVSKLPAGKPEDFTGAVGKFKLNASVDRKTVKTNEAVSYKVSLSGTGNINLFEIPEMTFPDDLEVFPPTSNFEKDAFRDDLTGTMTREYILIPRTSGTFVLPSAKLSYFDPDRKKWQSLSSQKISVQVKEGAEALTNRTDLTKEEVALLGKDIRYIKTDIPRWYRTGAGARFAGIFFIYLLAAGFFAGPALLRQYREHDEATSKNRRAGKALKLSLKVLSDPADDSYSLVSQAIYRYLQNKLHLNSDVMDPQAVRELIAPLLPEGMTNQLVRLLKICDEGRYSPDAAAAESSLVGDTRELLKKMDPLL